MKYFGVAISVIAFCLILVFAVLYAIYRAAFSVPRKKTLDPYDFPKNEKYKKYGKQMKNLVDGVIGIQYEEIYITSRTGLKLYGRYYEAKKGAPLQILFHGYRSNAIRDFCGGLQLALKSGCNALLIDERAHGKSEGKCLSFGIFERLDCLDWIDYSVKHFGKDIKIILVGISMGAATVLMTTEFSLPENVVGVIADCSYSSPEGIIRKVINDMHFPEKIVYPLIRLSGKIFGGFDIESASPEEALHNSKVPVLFIHGDDDGFVPYDMSVSNYNACASEKYFLTVHNADHGVSYLEDTESYTKEVYNFVKKVAGVSVNA